MNSLTIKEAINKKTINSLVQKVVADPNQAIKLVGNITSVIMTNPSLSNCSASSIIGASLIAQAINLPLQPQMGRCWVVPYNNKRKVWNNETKQYELVETKEAQFQMGYLGYVELLSRTGLYKYIGVRDVYEDEVGELDEFGELTFNWKKDHTDKKIVGYFAYLKMNSGLTNTKYMTVEEVKKHAKKYSKSYGNGTASDCWTYMFDKMAEKTVLKLLSKNRGVVGNDISLQTAIKYDSGIIDEKLNVEYVDNPNVEQNIQQDSLKLGENNGN